MSLKFDSLEELYNRLKPALNTKKNEMIRVGYTYIQEEDVWNYFKEVKWKNAQALSLHDMVNDVLNVDSFLIDEYLKSKLNEQKRTKNFDD